MGQPLSPHPSICCTLESLKESTSINLSGIGPLPMKTDKDQKQEVEQEANPCDPHPLWEGRYEVAQPFWQQTGLFGGNSTAPGNRAHHRPQFMARC